ncbi:MAG: precorrin-8X methylmutase [Clostridiales bacterium]|jgi:precorrin-8X/cobalt-precorrin-8 methylmutase|nr:precorrin-8X methylmutase [Clostridiales bacterium]
MEYLKPEDIENRSFEIIKSELPYGLDPALEPVILRVIHTTADFDYAGSVIASHGAVEKAVSLLRSGVKIISDTNMIKAGVDKTRLYALNSGIECFSGDGDVAEAARQQGMTRARAAMDKAASMNGPFIFAIGNAPTALLRIVELKTAGEYSPAFVIGVPVGFVNVTEAKEALTRSGIPFITALGRKGGSTVAVAVCNALLRLAAPPC